MTGGIILSFDDDHIEEWHEWLDFFNRHDVKATFYVCNMGVFTDAQWWRLREIQDAGHVIGHHGYRHLRAGVAGIDPASNPRLEGAPFYKDMAEFIDIEIMPGINALNGYGIHGRHYSYPFGNRNDASDEALLKIFKSLRKGGRTVAPRQDFPRVFGALDFGKNDKAEMSGHEGVIHHARAGNIVSFYMHAPVSHRIKWLVNYASEFGLEFLTPEDLF